MMQTRLALRASNVLLACLAMPLIWIADATGAVAPGATERAARIDVELPPVSQGDRTLKLSLPQWMDALAVPGLGLAVIDGYRVVSVTAYGVTAPGPEGSPVTPDTRFQAASIAKPLTALAVLRLVESDRFKLDAGINRYLTSWQLPDAEPYDAGRVTIRDLLAHTGGVTPGGFQGYPRTAALPTIVQVLDGAPPANNAAARIVAEPGREVAYSGLGYSLLQLALEDSLGQGFESILQDTVLGPLKLNHSTFALALPEAEAASAARGHLGTGAAVEGGWMVNPELAAAGLWTTPGDLALMAIDVAKSKRDGSGRLLSRDTARRMLTPQRDEMGLGFVVRGADAHGYFAHSGGNVGYFAHFEMLADTGQGIVLMTNSDAGRALASLVIASVANEYDWPLPDRRRLSPGQVERLFAQFDRVANRRVKVDVAPEVLAPYVGKYELSPGLLFDITLSEGQLQLQLGDQPRFPLFAESETKFFLEAVDAQISFLLDPDGKPEALVLHQGGRDQPAAKVE